MKQGLHIDEHGNRKWYQDDQLHRIDGPAYISKIFQSWWQYGLRHRLDGPAIEWTYGRQEWYLDGVRLSKSEFKNQIIKLNIQNLL